MNSISPPENSPLDSAVDGSGVRDSGRNKRRQRVAAACDECRAKKVKCDGSQPICTPCRRRHGVSASCSWGLRKVRSSGASKEELLRLQQRIDKLESGRQIIIPQDDSQAQSPPPPFLQGSDHTNHPNAMMGLMEDEHHNYFDHVSDSSAMGFMKHIKSVIDQQITPPDSHQSLQPVILGEQSAKRHQPSMKQHRKLDYVLPPRQRADLLLETYWRLVDTLYPFLDRDEVLEQYRCLWVGEPLCEEASTFLCLLNLIFSIACVLEPSIPPEERVISADVFYQRARGHLDFELIQCQSVLTVQCLLVLGQFLQSTNDPQQCWIFVGLAIRTAQSLGLDLPSTSSQAQSTQQRDLLRRVWHGCVLMDRALSMTFGRPAMVTSQAAASVPLPAAHNDESGCTCWTNTGRILSDSLGLHFFIESLKLYELMSETLLTLYNPSSREEPNDDLYTIYFGSRGAKAAGNIFEMDTKFRRWNRDLPLHLQCDPTIQKTAIHERQTNVLRLRYYHVRILLFRPILSRFCSRYSSSDYSLEEAMPLGMALQCSVMCVRTALETIEFFDSRMEGQLQEELDNLLPAWWYSIFYIYTAATVLVAAWIQPTVTAEVTEDAITNAWHAVLKALGRFQSFSKHAKRCTAALKVLFDQVPQQHRHKHELLQRQLQQKTLQQPHSHPRPNLERKHLRNHGGMDSFTSGNAGPSVRALTERADIDGNRSLNETDGVNSCTMPPTYPVISDMWNLPPEYSASSGLLDTTDLQLDFGNMSWLSSIPFDLYTQ